MNVKNTIKQIRCRLSRNYCYCEMSRSGHALMLFCEGKGVDIGDNGMKCVPMRCTKCPRYFEGFSVERYKCDIQMQRVPNIRKVDYGLPEWITRHQTEPIECPYCQKGEPLVIGKTNDYGIAIQYPNRLNAYGYDVHGTGSNGLIAHIKFCPMCGRKLV